MAKSETLAAAENAPDKTANEAQEIPAAPPEPTEAELIERRKQMLEAAGIKEQ